MNNLQPNNQHLDHTGRSSRRSRRWMAALAATSALALTTTAVAAVPAAASDTLEQTPWIAPKDLPPIPLTITHPIHLPITAQEASSPCFAVRTPDRWPAEVGEQPRCIHAYGSLVADELAP